MKQKTITQNTVENKTIFLGLGSNIENRKLYLDQAIKKLEEIIEIEKISSIYESEAVGYKEQEDFLNMVIKGRTKLSPKELLEKTQRIEKEIGREKTIENGPRKIDIDILYYNNEVHKEENLEIPHPEIKNRNFVLLPLVEIGTEFSSLLENLKASNKIKVWTQKK